MIAKNKSEKKIVKREEILNKQVKCHLKTMTIVYRII